MATTKICAAQMSALDTAGVFECEEEQWLRDRISNERIEATEETAEYILDMANGCDSIAHYEKSLSKETRAMYLNDSKALYRLHERIKRASVVL